MSRDFAGTVLRGLRSRALLSAGCILLAALAVASAVLGPVFQVAVTRSYVVSRINDAPADSTGLSRTFAPNEDFSGNRIDAEYTAAAFAARADRGPFGPVLTTLETKPFVGGLVETDTKEAATSTVLAKAGFCEHLIIDTGRCPTAPGETMILSGDAAHTDTGVGDRLELAAGLPALTVVGTYVIDEGEQEFWYDFERLTSHPRLLREPIVGPSLPYRPAPYLVVPEQFDAIAPTQWHLMFDRRLTIPPDWTEAQLSQARASGAATAKVDQTVAGGRITGDPVGNLPALLAEARTQEKTARASIAPAVLSLVLVALALLLRLLMAAAELRTPELALASLRGVSARRLWGLGLVEPLALLAVGVPLGLLLGFALSAGVMRAWLVPGLPIPLPGLLFFTVLAVVAAAVAVSVGAVGAVLTGSLSAQLTGVRRPKERRRVWVIGELVLVALVLAVLVSRLSVRKPGDPDVTDMVLPIALAVVAGLLTTRLIAALARWRARRPGRTLAGFVAARALGRRAEGTLVVLPLTAAIAVGVFGVGVYDAAAQWRTSVATTTSAGHTLWRAPGPMGQTLATTHRIDPAGEHVAALGALRVPGARLVVVDGPRMSRVLDWPATWSPGRTVDQVQQLIASQGAPVSFAGHALEFRFDNQVTAGRDLTLQLWLSSADGAEHSAYVRDLAPGKATGTVRLRYCRSGCTLTALAVAGPAGLPNEMSGTLTLVEMVARGKTDQTVPNALAPQAAWVTYDAPGQEQVATLDSGSDGVRITLDTGGAAAVARLAPGGVSPIRPIGVGVTYRDQVTTSPEGRPYLPFSGSPLLVDPKITLESLPLMGPNGALIDYRQLITNQWVYDDTVAAYAVTDADLPAAMRTQLRAGGFLVETTLADQEHVLAQGAYALALRLYSLVAILVLLMALAGLVVSTAVQLPARRRDAAALRVVGVPRRQVMSAVAREFAVVLAGAALSGIAAGALAQYVVTRTARLGYVETLATPALAARVDWVWVAVMVAGAGLVFGVFALASALVTVRGARGATLRESAR